MKKYRKIVLAGGNGYLGKILTEYYRHITEEVFIFSRTSKADDENVKTIFWDGQIEGAWISVLDGADLLINLCGKNVNCRYTKENKAAIFQSRIDPTRLLGKVIEKSNNPPKLWINITSATIYRHAEDHQHESLNGIINCTSPEPVKNGALMSIIRSSHGTSFGIPCPTWVLNIGAFMIGTETELILKSRWVIPVRLLECGYNFQFPKAEQAIKNILAIKV